MPGEFDLIQRFFTRSANRADVAVSVGDDCALLQVPPGQLLAVSTDTLIAGVHFPQHTSAYDIGWKSLAVNLSDLAAMGATPAWATLALTLPTRDDAWLQGFSAGLFALADAHQLALVGGDTTRGPLSITITVHGFVPADLRMRRNQAQIGDVLAVTGSLGDAGRALQHALATHTIADAADAEFLLNRLNRPTPRVQAALTLRPFVNAAIDISDGLLQDLQHVLTASHVGAILTLEQLPLSDALRRQCRSAEDAALFALNSGDDYELCLSIPAKHWPNAQAAAAAQGIALQRIGECVAMTTSGATTPEMARTALLWQGKPYHVTHTGYDHFAVDAVVHEHPGTES